MKKRDPITRACLSVFQETDYFFDRCDRVFTTFEEDGSHLLGFPQVAKMIALPVIVGAAIVRVIRLRTEPSRPSRR